MDVKIRQILNKVQNAARYTGGEFNLPRKFTHPPERKPSLSYCLCFPDLYEVAMSNLGIRILYNVLNNEKDILCERCFTPAEDMAILLKENGIGLFSIENKRPLRDFDAIGFSFQYELSYSNFLYMLDLAGLKFEAAERGENDPIVMAGGPCMVNPEPLAEFLDIVVIGDGERTLKELAKMFIKMKAEGKQKGEIIRAAAAFEGVYVPALMKVRRDKDGAITGFSGIKKVTKARVNNLNAAPFPDKILVPNIEIVHDRAVLELFRGCGRGCRFCQAGFVYRPVRARNVKTLQKQAINLMKYGGYEELSLSSLSTGDYCGLSELIASILPYARAHGVSLALPSLRADSFNAETVENSRRSSLTFAPEAGTQRLRDVINKNITEDDILSAAADAFKKGYSSVKLYFMIGLPTETTEDIKGIVDLAVKIKSLYRTHRSRDRDVKITVGAAVFIPKPFTPFQWAAQGEYAEIRQKQEYLKKQLKSKNINVNYHDMNASMIEAMLARGDRRLCAVLEDAYRLGAKMDGWSEFFKPEYYFDALKANKIDIARFLRKFDGEEILAWDFVNIGVKKEYLLSEYKKAAEATTTGSCQAGCNFCGLENLCSE
jgi:radical SAM family uncharacterized protein